MKILYDHQAFTGSIYGGVPRYFADLMEHLELMGQSVELATWFSNNFYIQNKSYYKGKPYRNVIGSRTPTICSHLNRANAAMCLLMKNYDVFHPTFYNPYFLDFLGKKPFVLTYHDAIKDKFGDQYAHLDNVSKEKKQSILARASKIIAVSENTKMDLVEVFDVNPDKVAVIHHATNFQEILSAPVRDLPERYLLYVGSRVDYKFFLPFLRAVSQLLIDENIHLVCAGGGNLSVGEREEIEVLNLKEKVIVMHIDDGKLKTMYQKAIAFVYPSKYEGFGIPILEAFASDCPVILNDSSSFPEVAGDAALYFDALIPDSIVNAVKKVVKDPELRDQLIKKGRERFNDFSIQEMTCQTLAIYESVV